VSNWDHNEGRPATMKDVEGILSQIRPPENSNPDILAIDALTIMRAKQNGYPKHLYHEALEPVLALNKFQHTELMKIGYVEHYIPREYPKVLFRRNMDPRFDLRRDPGTKEPLNHEHVEERMVRSKEAEAALKKQPAPAGCGPWVQKLTDIEPLPDGPDEHPDVTIARLQGELAESRRTKTKEKAAP
jgi:hypothetical protein